MASKKVDNSRDLAPMTDPIAYRESYDPRNIKSWDDLIVYQDWNSTTSWWENTDSTVEQNTQSNVSSDGTIKMWPLNANLNYYQYWDDSNPNQQSQKWWMNDKYTWEGVKNTYIWYDPNITTSDLDPNYLYGDNARQQNRKEAWYIARRNDMIASALYNEWLTSKEQVAEFLSNQKDWMNSTEADRLNTIESVWKRLWEIKPQEQPDPSKANDIVKDTSGKIYGKNTAEEWNPKKWIDTLADDNSVFTAMQESRVTTLKNMLDLWVDNLAVMQYSWADVYWDQAWRDFRQYYPDQAVLVDQKIKELKAQDTANAISSGWDLPTNNNTIWSVNNNIADFSNKNASSTVSSAEITKNINTMLDNNETAQTAQELMWTLEWEMAVLKNRMKNLRAEANAAFKWDVPDYLVNAYINNKSQEIQNQLSILEDRYNAAYKRYTTEVSQSQWQQEFQLKKDQLKLQQDEFDLKKRSTEQWIAIDWAKVSSSTWSTTTTTTNSWKEIPVTSKSREEIWWIIDDLVDMAYNKQLGKSQCATWIQRYYFPKLWISIYWLSTFEAKKWLINTEDDYIPQKWDLIIINSWAKLEDWTPAWHIWIVVQVDWDKVKYLDWNWDWKENPAIRTKNLSDKSISWYCDVTKWQQQQETVDNSSFSRDFTDTDYANFEAFLDNDKKTRMNKTEKETLAAQYWFKDDLQWFTDFAIDAIANRPEGVDNTITEVPEWKVSTNEQGRTVITKPNWEAVTYAPWITADYKFIWTWRFDPKLWYDPSLRELYQKFNNGEFKASWVLNDYATMKWRTLEELWNEATNYQTAVDSWLDKYSDLEREVSRDWWFAVNKKDIYSDIWDAIAKKWWVLDDNLWLNYAKQLWIDTSNKSKAIETARTEYDNYNKWYNETMQDESVYRLVNALEYIIMQDASYVQRLNIMAATDDWWKIDPTQLRWEAADWAVMYNYILADEVFKKLTNTKAAWATLYPVSDADMKMVRDASTLLNWNQTQDNFHAQINKMYKDIRQYLWKPVTDAELKKMWNTEWKSTFASSIADKIVWWPDFSNYLTIDHARYSWLLWWISYWSNKKNNDTTSYNWIWDMWGSKQTKSWTGSYSDNIMQQISGS